MGSRVLAGSSFEPLLLTATDSLSTETRNAIQRQGLTGVTIDVYCAPEVGHDAGIAVDGIVHPQG